MKIKGLEFVRTCSVCPEQYDVYDERGNVVGYVRLRWGRLTCEYPDVGGEIIYTASIGEEGWCGSFESEIQRKTHLEAAAGSILERLQNQNKAKREMCQRAAQSNVCDQKCETCAWNIE